MTNANPSWGWAAGGVISTAGDLAIYAQHLVGGGLLDAKYQKKRLDSLRVVDPSNPKHGRYGYALLQIGNLIGHNGSLPGYQTFIAYNPTNENDARRLHQPAELARRSGPGRHHRARSRPTPELGRVLLARRLRPANRCRRVCAPGGRCRAQYLS